MACVSVLMVGLERRALSTHALATVLDTASASKANVFAMKDGQDVLVQKPHVPTSARTMDHV